MHDRIRSALAGHYVLERILGRGATAAVYAARDLKHGRRVALKVLEPAVASTLGPDRFLQEIRTTAGLSHPNILPLFDSGAADGFIYFTMPVVEGESLRARIERDGALETAAALHIAAQIGSALACAHGSGVVHRDIKPDNILLTPQGHVWVADFGLARALATAADRRFTGTGFAVGSPHYMSPEQAAGSSNIDARSDIYSFGCVVFEMLTGAPPFRDGTVETLLARHMTEAPPSARALRADIPEHVDRAVACALAKDRAARFGDVGEFVGALRGEVPAPAVRQTATGTQSGIRRWLAPAALLLTTLVGLLFWRADGLTLGGFTLPLAAADTSMFVILPFDHEAGATYEHEDQMLRDAFVRWRDVRVVDGFQVMDAVARREGGRMTVGQAREIARELQAGRVVRGRIATNGDSLVVHAALYDAGRARRPLAESMIRLPRGAPNAEQYYARLAEALLFREAASDDATPAGTDSRAARRAYLAAEQLVWQWDLARADSLFTQALEEDPRYADALLWRAQVRFWIDGSSTRARLAAEAAAAAADRLDESRRGMAAGLVALTSGDYPAACATYAAMLEQNPRGFIAVRGLADCHQLDNRVVADPRSPTGYAFRSSGHQALRYHRYAFELVPASHRAFRSGRFLHLREQIFYTALSALRNGRSASGEAFRARPSWEDTLAFHPVPLTTVVRSEGIDGSAVTAVTHMRQAFFDVTAGWVAAYPRSVDALEAHAIAMELQGDTRATAMLELARSYTDDPEHRVNLSISEFWLRFKRGPTSVATLRAARLLADSVLAYEGAMSETTAARLAAVAAVTGRAHRAAQLARQSVRAGPKPLRVAQAGAALLAYAALGGPADSVAAYERVVENSIGNLMQGEDGGSARAELLGRAGPLALPAHVLSYVHAPDRYRDYMLDAIVALSEGRTDSVRAMLADVAADRVHARPADIKLEGLLVEAWLLVRIGDHEVAAARLGPTLDEIGWIEPGGLENVAAAGPLARSMLLRAEIAHALADRATARRWASAFAELWRDADAELQPRVALARRLAAQ
jgi:tRNA A-37 threonylcarbamoyl transferase component Bud32